MTRIEYTRQVTADVISGFRLYAKLTGEDDPSLENSAYAKWRYWFESNPYSEGFFAVAKNNDDVVGFRSLIPVPMQVNERRLLAGKNEFFVVAPEFRRNLAQNPNLRLPEALYEGLRTWAYQQGVEAHFDVAIPPVMALAAKYGATTLEFPSVRHSFPFEQLFVRKRAHGKRNALRRMAWSGMMRALRSWALFRAPSNRAAKWNEYSEFDRQSCSPPHGLNEIVAADVETLQFRFPPEGALKLKVTSSDDSREARFVFSKPASDSECRLFYWTSDLADTDDLLGIAAVEMIRRCATARARRLVAVLPAADVKASRQLRKLGFRGQPIIERVAIHFRDSDCKAELVPEKWAFNSLHQRFYQDG